MSSKQLKVGVVLAYLTIFTEVLVNIFITPLKLELLGQAQFGLFSMVNSVVANIGLLSFGFGSGYIRFYSRFKNDDDENGLAQLNGLFFAVFSFVSLLSLFLGTWLYYNAPLVFGDSLTLAEINDARIISIVLVINVALQFPFSLFNLYLIANEKFIYQKSIRIVGKLLTPFLTLVALSQGLRAIGMVVVILFVNVLVGCIDIYKCLKNYKMKLKLNELDLGLLKEIVPFTSFIFLNIVAEQFNWSIDRYILGRVWGTVPVSVYAVAAILNTSYRQLGVSISSVFTSRINRLVLKGTSNNELTDIFIRIGRIQLMILSLVLSGFYIFGKPFIEIWVGSQYSEAYYIALMLMGAVTISVSQEIGIEIQRAKNKHRFRSILYFLIAVLNVGLTLVLCPKYGAIGCAIGTVCSVVVGNVIIMNVYYHKVIGLNMIKYWRHAGSIIPIILVLTVLGTLFTNQLSLINLVNLSLAILVYTCMYGSALWCIWMNSHEKALILKPLSRITK